MPKKLKIVVKTHQENIDDTIAHFKNKYGIPQGSIDNIMSFVGDNLYMFSEDDKDTPKYQSMELATIEANFQTFLDGDWFNDAYNFEGAEKFKK